MPLLRAMHLEAKGAGRVITMRQQKWWAADLRKHLVAARIDRAALFRNDATCKRLRFHDLRGTGLTWMAIRGDDPQDPAAGQPHVFRDNLAVLADNPAKLFGNDESGEGGWVPRDSAGCGGGGAVWGRCGDRQLPPIS